MGRGRIHFTSISKPQLQPVYQAPSSPAPLTCCGTMRSALLAGVQLGLLTSCMLLLFSKGPPTPTFFICCISKCQMAHTSSSPLRSFLGCTSYHCLTSSVNVWEIYVPVALYCAPAAYTHCRARLSPLKSFLGCTSHHMMLTLSSILFLSIYVPVEALYCAPATHTHCRAVLARSAKAS